MNLSDRNKVLISLAALLLMAAVSAAFFYACYRFDNKYTADGPRAREGILLLDAGDLERYPVMFLIRDWMIYRDKLLTPADFEQNPPAPDELVFIGQYGGFEGNAGSARSPHGCATYRLNIFLPPETRSYTLELPEIYSAYKLYINGELMAQMGEPDRADYRPQTGKSSVTVQAAGRMEILFAVSNYSYIYSGMVYPPAFGEPNAVANLLFGRIALRVTAIAAALCVGLMNLCLWLLTRKESGKNADSPSPLYYAALCVCFMLYTGYPVVKTLTSAGMWWYAVESLAYLTTPLLAACVQRPLTGVHIKWLRPFAVLTAFACLWALTVPFFMGDNLTLMMAYSWLLDICAWACAINLTTGAVYAVIKGAAHGRVMLAGIAVYDAALITDKLFPMFEPIRFGWFNEIGGGILVLFTGYVMIADVAMQYRLRLAVENRAERVTKMLEVQRAYYPALMKKEEETKTARHDFRHHISVIKQLYSEGGDKLGAYLDNLDDRRIQAAEPSVYCKHPIVNTLLWMYGELAKEQDTRFYVRASLPETLPVSDADLCVVLSNLLENALEAVKKLPPEDRSVTVNTGRELDGLGILITNPFNGEFAVKNGCFLSAKQPRREGVGLASVNSVCKSYGGYASFGDDGNGMFRSEAFIPLPNGGYHANSDL